MRSWVPAAAGYSFFRAGSLPPPSAGCKRSGGAEEARTPDPLLAKEVLSQLSYGPLYVVSSRLEVGSGNAASAPWRRLTRRATGGSWHELQPLASGRRRVVGHSGLEPETSVLSGLRSNQLS